VGDGYLIARTVDVQFDVLWRNSTGRDLVLATARHTFAEPPAGPAHDDAVPFETDMAGVAAAAKAGDKLVLKFSVTGGDPAGNYTPNGDGPQAKGRYPSLTLP
jgi:hypothetical protein